MKRMSRSPRPVRIAATSPLRSSAGPAAERRPTPSSSRTMKARLVLPSPGGPISSRWSSASPRERVASSAIASCSLTRSWPTNSSSERGRSERSSSSSSGCTAGARNCVSVSVTPRPQGLAHALLGRELRIGRGERLLGLGHRPAELDQRVARHRVRLAGDRRRLVHRAELLLQLQHDALRGLLADPGDRLEAGRVVERDRAPQVARRRARDDRERDLRPDARDREQVLEQLALGGLAEAVELERVLAHVQVGVERDLSPALGQARGRRGHGQRVADAADVEHDPLAGTRDGSSPQARDHTERLGTGTDVPAAAG